jgi:DNA-binding protein HU-beta
MKKHELINRIAEQTGLTKAKVESVLKAQTDAIYAALGSGQDVTIQEVGKLKPVLRAARTARNPQTGEEMALPASRGVKFAPSKILKEALN